MTAGLANEVDDVNQYAAVMYAYGKRNGIGSLTRAAPYLGHQAKRGDKLAEDLEQGHSSHDVICEPEEIHRFRAKPWPFQ